MGSMCLVISRVLSKSTKVTCWRVLACFNCLNMQLASRFPTDSTLWKPAKHPPLRRCCFTRAWCLSNSFDVVTVWCVSIFFSKWLLTANASRCLFSRYFDNKRETNLPFSWFNVCVRQDLTHMAKIIHRTSSWKVTKKCQPITEPCTVTALTCFRYSIRSFFLAWLLWRASMNVSACVLKLLMSADAPCADCLWVVFSRCGSGLRWLTPFCLPFETQCNQMTD